LQVIKTKLSGPTEDQVQKAIIDYAKHVKYKGRQLAAYLHHSPNGGKRATKVGKNGKTYSPEAQKFKAMGTKAGYPDLILDIAKGGYHGLRIELKTAKGRPTKLQLERIGMLNDEGYKAVVAYGSNDAISVIKDYMGLED
jgi:hypothetical protein